MSWSATRLSVVPWKDGFACWIIQLVVASPVRRQGIATKLCQMASDSNDAAVGLVSSHPYTIRALERAMQSTCRPSIIATHAASLVQASGIPCVQDCPLRLGEEGCSIDTQSFVYHTKLNVLLSKEKEWQLGPLNEGEEFFAFVFREL